jgi:hypothetical protein
MRHPDIGLHRSRQSGRLLGIRGAHPVGLEAWSSRFGLWFARCGFDPAY